jgi:hypothetical protein
MPFNTSTATAVQLRALAASDEAVRALGWDRSAFETDAARISLAAQLADEVAKLHEQGFTHGDVTLYSAVLAGEPPQVRLSARPAEPTGWGRTPFFLPPEVADGSHADADERTDVYQLGLCVIRLLARGPGAIQLRDPTAVGTALKPDGVELLGRCVGRDRNRRPRAREVARFLRDRVEHLTRPPELLELAVLRPIELPGADAIVTWSQRYATKLRIIGTNGFEVSDLDPDAHPHGYTIRPPSTGPIFVEISNPYGSVVRQAGFIAFYEPPRFSLDEHLPEPLPRVAVPDLSRVPPPRTLPPLPRRPVVGTDEHPPPRLVAPSIAEALSHARPAQREDATRAAIDSFREISQQMSQSARRILHAGLQTLGEQVAAAVHQQAAEREGPQS